MKHQSMPVRVHLWIKGRVQGVSYRLNAQVNAEDLGLTGWVRNLSDGRVEAVVEGEPNAVEQFIAWCQRGPFGARVDEVRRAAEPVTRRFDQFSIAASI